MAGKRITVVISQTQSQDPVKRHLEEEIATQLVLSGKADVSLVPHLYDMTAQHTGMLFLKSVPGDLIVMSWLYPRAIRWILDRNGVKGRAGSTLPADQSENEDDDLDDDLDGEVGNTSVNGIGAWNLPDRTVYCIDLRDHADAKVLLDEVHRIAAEASVQTTELMQWIKGTPQTDQLQQYLNPQQLPNNGSGDDGSNRSGLAMGGNGSQTAVAGTGTQEQVKRRWYPVIDYSRCTNCMECIDFCLFGVYGVDQADRILVELQDNCKKGCPACSRVCPEHAIIFPGHKTAAIAGTDVGNVESMKIDLSKLFGAPSALEIAAQERDVELMADGRGAVGLTVGIPKRQAGKPTERDELDDLIDGLDSLDL